MPNYPFRRVGSADSPSLEALRSLARTPLHFEQVELTHKPSPRFVAREESLAVTEELPYGLRPPNWVLARFAQHASVATVIDDLFKRLSRSPSEKNMRFTQHALNELGRRRGGGRLLRRIVTQKLVDEYQAREEG
jgi:hypothetical protein